MNGTPPRGRWRSRIAHLIDLIDDRVSRRADARARELGHVITRIPGTRTQRYRDPRWDLRRECDRCAGSGLAGAHACAPCSGTGVRTLDATPLRGEPR